MGSREWKHRYTNKAEPRRLLSSLSALLCHTLYHERLSPTPERGERCKKYLKEILEVKILKKNCEKIDVEEEETENRKDLI